MLGELDGACLVDVDMAGAHTEDALILIEHGVNGGGVGLCAASEEEDLGIGQSAGLTDEVAGLFGELVEAVGRGTGIVVTHKGVENKGMGAVGVVAGEGRHGFLR